jgi:hypothetical protein
VVRSRCEWEVDVTRCARSRDVNTPQSDAGGAGVEDGLDYHSASSLGRKSGASPVGSLVGMYGIALERMVSGTPNQVIPGSSRWPGFKAIGQAVRGWLAESGFLRFPCSRKKIFPSRLPPSGSDVSLPGGGLYRSSNDRPRDGFGNVFMASNPLNGRNLCHVLRFRSDWTTGSKSSHQNHDRIRC